MQSLFKPKYIYLLCTVAIGIILLGHLYVAYPGLRTGINGLIGLVFAGIGIFGVYSAADMYKARGHYIKRSDWAISQLPTAALALIVSGLLAIGMVVVGG